MGKKHGKAFYEGLDRKRTHHVTALIAHFGAGCRKPKMLERGGKLTKNVPPHDIRLNDIEVCHDTTA
jgi:hypothetical protein